MSGSASRERDEIERIRQVSDMLCTGHSYLRDRFAFIALIVDIFVLGASTWLLALTFVEPLMGVNLTPFGVEPRLWIGVLGAVTFFATLLQMRANWKGRSDAHRRSFDMYAEVHRECGYLLAQGPTVGLTDSQRVISRYDMATDVGTPLPEKYFLRLKRKHKLKVAISRHLDANPGASVLIARVVFWWQGTQALFGSKRD